MHCKWLLKCISLSFSIKIFIFLTLRNRMLLKMFCLTKARNAFIMFLDLYRTKWDSLVSLMNVPFAKTILKSLRVSYEVETYTGWILHAVSPNSTDKFREVKVILWGSKIDVKHETANHLFSHKYRYLILTELRMMVIGNNTNYNCQCTTRPLMTVHLLF